ncbi:MAG: hypothetical protein FWD17_05055, partial [Polyangiaceae bacterium]|nr:hypothetical protein [Polyangiaceae bacterium]
GDDLQKLAAYDRVLAALYDIGNLALIRAGQWFGYYHPLVHDAVYCHRQVILGSLPGGRFGFTWSLRDAPSLKALLEQRATAIPIYKQIRDAYRKAPARWLAQVNDACDLESQILFTLLGAGNVPDDVYQEVWKTNDWLGSTPSGDPPDDTKGLGILLGMLRDPLPPELDPPSSLYKLVATTLVVDGALSSHDDSTRSALETRIKAGLSSALDLPSDLRSKLKEPSGWKKLEDAWKAAATGTKQVNAGAKEAKAAIEVVSTIWPKRVAKLAVGRFGDKDALAGLRLIGLFATGIALVDDMIKLGESWANEGDSSAAGRKLEKDTLSAFGTFARDYYKVRLQIANWQRARLLDSEKTALKEMEAAFKPAGAALGAVSGVWSAGIGIADRNALMTISGVANAIGSGIKWFFADSTAGIGLRLEPLAPWLVLIGASVDIFIALEPPKGDALMRKQATAMMKGVADTLRHWYTQCPPWRAGSPDFEDMLKNVESMIKDVDREDPWKSMLAFSAEDVKTIRARLVEIGFNQSDAEKLAPIEPHKLEIPALGPIEPDYWLRGTPPPALAPGIWPPNWPALESE